MVRGKTETVDRAGEDGLEDQIVSVSGERGGQTDPDTFSRDTARTQVMPVNQTVLPTHIYLQIKFF